MTAALRASLVLLLLGGCEGGGAVSSPVVRVDLRARLPEKLQRRLAVADAHAGAPPGGHTQGVFLAMLERR